MKWLILASWGGVKCQKPTWTRRTHIWYWDCSIWGEYTRWDEPQLLFSRLHQINCMGIEVLTRLMWCPITAKIFSLGLIHWARPKKTKKTKKWNKTLTSIAWLLLSYHSHYANSILRDRNSACTGGIDSVLVKELECKALKKVNTKVMPNDGTSGRRGYAIEYFPVTPHLGFLNWFIQASSVDWLWALLFGLYSNKFVL